MHQLGSHSRIDPSTNSSNHLTLFPTNLPNPGNLSGDKRVHAPTSLDPADVVDKRTDDFFSSGRVGDFGVELDAEEGFGFVRNGGPGGSGGVGDLDKVFREGLKLISVGHPDLCTSVGRSTPSTLVIMSFEWAWATHLHTTLILTLQTIEQSIGQLVASLLDGHPSKPVFPVSMSPDFGSESLGDFLSIRSGVGCLR